MIEDMFDEEYGFISASRSYYCAETARVHNIDSAVHLGQHPDGYLVRIYNSTATGATYEEMDCYFCGRGPILFDRSRHLPYVLIPFVIEETP